MSKHTEENISTSGLVLRIYEAVDPKLMLDILQLGIKKINQDHTHT